MKSLLTALLAKVTDASLGDSIAGDLEEQRRRRSRAGATFWYLHAAISVLGYFWLRKVGGAMRTMIESGLGIPGGRDIQHALRSLRRSPWYALTVVVVITLGMTLAATTFAIVDGVLFKPLPYPHADDLISVQPGVSGTRGTPSVTPNELDEWASAMPDIEFTGFEDQDVSGLESVNERAHGSALVRQNFFEVIGVRPLIGGFTREHYADASGPAPVIVSYDLWQARFGGAADIIGRRLQVDARIVASGVCEVVGVMPKGFVFPYPTNPQVIRPFAGTMADPNSRSLRVIMRRAAGGRADVAALEQRLEAAMKALAAGRDPAPGGSRFLGPFDEATMRPLAEYLTRASRPLIAAVFWASAVLVLIACVNVSGLVAARTLDRTRELALRRALGARSADIVRTTLAETALLLAAGGALALVLAGPMLQFTAGLLPEDLVLLKTPAIDWRVVGYVSLAVAISVGLVSILPVVRALRAGIGPMPGATSQVGTTAARRRGSAVLVSFQVAAALVLTIGGALFVTSLGRVVGRDPGLDPDGLLIIELRVIPDGRSDAGETPGVAPRVRDYLDRVRAIPGVTAAGVVDAHVLDGGMWTVANFWPPEPIKRISHLGFPVSSGFFEAARVPLRYGRLPTTVELDAGAPVAVISEVVADAYWPGQSAIGQHVINRSSLARVKRERVFTVIGVVGEAQYSGWDDRVSPIIYAPYAALNFSAAPVAFVRVSPGARGVLERIIAAADQDGPRMKAVRAAAASTVLADTIRPRRLQSWLFGSFAAAALATVGAGVLGLVATMTVRRTREVGIRMALGATRQGIVRLILREQFVAVAIGVGLGAAAAGWAVALVRSYLFEITPYDPRVWAVAIGLIVAVTAAGVIVPARRASTVDPVRALRVE